MKNSHVFICIYCCLSAPRNNFLKTPKKNFPFKVTWHSILCNYVVSGECWTLSVQKYFREYLTPEEDHISVSRSIAYNLESVDIDGEERIFQNGTSSDIGPAN
jgi:hypothetical protein